MRIVKNLFLEDEFSNVLSDEISNRLFMREVNIMLNNADNLFITSVDKITAFNNANELEFILDEIQDCTISNSQDNTDITGKNGAVIGTLKRNKAVTISGNNGFIVAGGLSAQTGSDVQVGSYVIRTMEIWDVASNSVTITSEPDGPEGAEIVAVYKRNSNSTMGEKFEQNASATSTGQFSYDNKVLTFFEGDLEDGDQVVVFYDTEVTDATIVSNNADEYSKTLKLWIDVTVQDACDRVFHGCFIIFRADFTGVFDIAMGSDAAVLAFEARSIKNLCASTADAGKLWDFVVW